MVGRWSRDKTLRAEKSPHRGNFFRPATVFEPKSIKSTCFRAISTKKTAVSRKFLPQ